MPITEKTVLDNISFKLQLGERLGLIGRNGAGKSMLLRTIAGIYKVSSGTLDVNGSARGLFDISSGMQPKASGYENIYLRGLQMGLGLREIRCLVPSVIEFSGLEDHINDRLLTYSSGMRMRLAISISIMIKPDILLLDEWIGTGDANFNAKVKKRMNSMINDSRGLVLATHNNELMKSLCDRGLVLDKGRVLFSGNIDAALSFYSTQVLNK